MTDEIFSESQPVPAPEPPAEIAADANEEISALTEPSAPVDAPLQAEPTLSTPSEEERLDGNSTAASPTASVPVESSPSTPAEDQGPDDQSSFAEMLSEFESAHKRTADTKQLQGTVVSISADQVFVDVGYKMEGALPRAAFENNAEAVKLGDRFPVSITGRNEEGYYTLSRHRVAQPRDWSALEQAFAEKSAVAGTVTAVIKGGLSVDIGVRAFMPLSRSGARDAAEVAALVGQPITCRITKLDTADEDVVVDRRIVLEEQARTEVAGRRAALQPSDTVTGTVRTLMPYGAFVELAPGLDGLLHISDISRARVAKPEDILSVGQQLTLRILKIDEDTGKISLGLKQLEADPWTTAPERYLPGARVAGVVTRLMDFGAFVEIEPGLEGLIHISEMSWAKKVRHPSDLLNTGDRVDAVILSVKPEEKRIALGLKQTLADPWLDVERGFPVGSQVEGPVTKLMNFGAFIQIAEGVDGLVHVSEIIADRRINHPRDVLRDGQVVKALVLAIDPEKRQIKLSMKQLIPTSIDEYIAEHKPGDVVSGRVVELTASGATVELGEGIHAALRTKKAAAASTDSGRTGTLPPANQATPSPAAATAAQKTAASASSSGAASDSAKPDLSQLSSMLKARWKGNSPAPAAGPEPLAPGQVRTFKITKLEADTKLIEVTNA